MKIPISIKNKVNSSFKNKKSSWYNNFHQVTDETLLNWLTKNSTITTDSAITDFGFFKARFCWYSQKWIISA